MRIGVIIAMDVEYRQMRAAIGGETGRLANNEVFLWQCGVGKVNAAVNTYHLIQKHQPEAIISTGLAGGIDAQVGVMDVLAASQCVYHDVDCGFAPDDCVFGQVQGLPARFDADDQLLNHAMKTRSLLADPPLIHSGLICTGDQFITDYERLSVIKRNFPDGLACDMESAAIAQTCYLLKIPFLSLRVISDTPGRTEDHQQQWDSFLASMCASSFRFVKQYLETI